MQVNETCQKYFRPENCAYLTLPTVNPPIWDNLPTKTRSMGLKIQRCQKPLVKGKTAVAKAFEKRGIDEKEQDAVALLANAVFEINMLPKELIKPEINA
ncbi:hypothetical protein HOLleu_12873 [Holothuria leucospilota]|uniref:Uncharacterized protein n=1 Tax=Holothuria leucospilota TaxID=206669 RepID=A0A9Q1CC23_HOLLE|nr:hypothetical protein HOLleu_12873 [Holothuria leucospilota]